MAEPHYTLALSPGFDTILKRLKRQKPELLHALDRYEISGTEVRLLDFDHHDLVYKKYFTP